MNDVGDNIIKVFSSSFELLSKQETCNEYIVDYQIGALNLSLHETDITDKINLRDQIALHFFESDDAESIDYLSSKTNNCNNFIN